VLKGVRPASVSPRDGRYANAFLSPEIVPMSRPSNLAHWR
jgi:hypothetical protein